MTDPSPSIHVPVLLEAILHWLAPRPGAVLVDGTLGGGGHARALAERVHPRGKVIALDRDPEAVDAVDAGLPIHAVHADYRDLPEVLASMGIERVDGIVLDLGMSSDQLADPRRGFSFHADGPFDLRFDPTRGDPAWRLVNRLSAEHLADLIYHYGEERYSRRIARAIVERRRRAPITSAAEMAELIRRVVPRSRHGSSIDPATRTFQAFRIAVNEELKSLEIALRRLPDTLRPGARLAVISFHSLEDRRVKQSFRDDDRLKVLTRKPVLANDVEVEVNPRARSAKLRVGECVAREHAGS